MKNVFESMALALKEFKDNNEDELVLDSPEENATDERIEGEVVQPVIDPELGYESETGDIDMSGRSYIGKKVIDCNICGSAFFADELTPETVCPLCTASSEDLQVVGVVVPEEQANKPAEPSEPVADDTVVDDKPEEKDESEQDQEKEEESFNFDENAMNKLIETFLKENYNDFKSYKTSQTILTGNNKLRVQGIVETTNGVKKNVVFLTEALNLMEGGAKKLKASCPAFSGNRENAFVFEGKLDNKTLVFDKMSYRYVVKHNNESYQVSGKASL